MLACFCSVVSNTSKVTEVYVTKCVHYFLLQSAKSPIPTPPRPSPPSPWNYLVRLSLWCAQKRE